MKEIWKKISGIIVVQVIFHLLYEGTNVIFPVIHQYLFDHVSELTGQLVLGLVGIYLLGYVLNAVFQYISQYYEWKLARAFFIEMKQKLFVHILGMPMEEYQEKHATEYVSLFNNDVEELDESYIDPVVDLIKSALSLIVFFVALVWFVDWRVAMVIVIASIIAVFVPNIVGGELSKRRKSFFSRLEQYNGRLTDLLLAKSRVNQDTFAPFVHNHVQQLEETEFQRIHYGQFNTLSNVLNGSVMFFIQLMNFALVAYLVLRGEITVGAAVATFSYVENFIYPIKNILNDLNYIHSTKDTLQSLEEQYLEKPLPHTGKYVLQPFENLQLQQMKPFTATSKGMTMTLKHGAKYVVTGKSGIGKSVYLQTAGEKNLQLQTKQQKILEHPENYVFYLYQQEHFFQASYEEQVSLFGTYHDSLHRAKGLWDLLTEEQRDSLLHHSIKQLSGGEKCLLGILRALTSDKPILLLDEPTANLDKETSTVVLDYLLSLRDTTILMVLHEESTEILNRFDGRIHFTAEKVETF